jgi:hypothetical protein
VIRWFTALNIFRHDKTPRAADAPQQNGTTKGESKSMSDFAVFPSPTFQTQVRSAAERIDKIRAEIEALEVLLPKLRKNRDAVELSGKNPDEEIRTTGAQITEAERELSRAKDSMSALFSAERERHGAARQRLWEAVYLDSVHTATTQIASLVLTLRKMSEQLVELKAAPVIGAPSASTLDADAAAHNVLVVQHKLPSNCLINPGESLSFCFQHAVREILRHSDLDAALKKLREDLEALTSKQAVSQFDTAFTSAPGSRKLWAGRQ